MHSRSVDIEVKHTERNSILMGHHLGDAEVDGHKISVVAIGNYMEITIDGEQYRAEINGIAETALRLHKELHTG